MAPFLRMGEGGRGVRGIFKPLLSVGTLFSGTLVVALSPQLLPRRENLGVVCFGVGRAGGWRAVGGDGRERLVVRGWFSRSCAKDGWQNGGISFYYASSLGTGLSIRSEELAYRSPKNGTRSMERRKKSSSRSLIIDRTNDNV